MSGLDLIQRIRTLLDTPDNRQAYAIRRIGPGKNNKSFKPGLLDAGSEKPIAPS